jgi:hypothetical protein
VCTAAVLYSSSTIRDYFSVELVTTVIDHNMIRRVQSKILDLIYDQFIFIEGLYPRLVKNARLHFAFEAWKFFL